MKKLNILFFVFFLLISTRVMAFDGRVIEGMQQNPAFFVESVFMPMFQRSPEEAVTYIAPRLNECQSVKTSGQRLAHRFRMKGYSDCGLVLYLSLLALDRIDGLDRIGDLLNSEYSDWTQFSPDIDYDLFSFRWVASETLGVPVFDKLTRAGNHGIPVGAATLDYFSAKMTVSMRDTARGHRFLIYFYKSIFYGMDSGDGSFDYSRHKNYWMGVADKLFDGDRLIDLRKFNELILDQYLEATKKINNEYRESKNELERQSRLKALRMNAAKAAISNGFGENFYPVELLKKNGM